MKLMTRYVRAAYEIKQKLLRALRRTPLPVTPSVRQSYVKSIKYPVQFYDFIYDMLHPTTRSVTTLKQDSSQAISAVRFKNIVELLSKGEHPVQYPVAAEIALYADRIRSNLRSFDHPPRHTDVGQHFSSSSSLGIKGRLLANLVRISRPKSCLEAGTAYGISTHFIATAQASCGIEPRIVTIEGFSPQTEISALSLIDKYGVSVRPLHGMVDEVLKQLASEPSTFDFFFHDARHRGDDYVNDFLTVLPMLNPGALVVIDDIRWDELSTSKVEPSSGACYQGWLEVVQHKRVACAIEVDGSIGVMLIGDHHADFTASANISRKRGRAADEGGWRKSARRPPPARRYGRARLQVGPIRVDVGRKCY